MQSNDYNHLRTNQYRDATNLNARIALHERFSTNPYGWQRWIFDHLALRPDSRVLELGCGPGLLWVENLHRIPAACQITLTDFSPGMIAEAQRNLSRSRHNFRFEVVDAQSIPYEAGSFDVVIANHMLYHVPDREAALSESQRVLRPGGRFYASTIGRDHLREIPELVHRFDPSIVFHTGELTRGFGLENGRAQLARWFSQITLYRYEDALVITEAGPLVAYIMSGLNSASTALSDDKLAAFARFVETELAQHGAIHVTKASGMFEAVKILGRQ